MSLLHAPDLHVPDGVKDMHPTEVFRWAFDTYGVENVAVTSSFEDAVLAHLAVTANPAADIVLLDTQYLFAETWWLVEEMQRRFDINLRVVSAASGGAARQPVADRCRGLLRHSQGRAAATARSRERPRGSPGSAAPTVRHVPTRRSSASTSAGTSSRSIRSPRGPTTTSRCTSSINQLPVNPLSERGYPSIGCWPCTRPVAEGEDRRGGRWAGNAKTECGLHV